METTRSIAVYSQSSASMRHASWPEESDQFILNWRIFAVPLCSKLTRIGEVEVASVPDVLRRAPWKHPGENPRLLSILPSCRSRHSSLSPSTAVHLRSRAHRSKLRGPKSGGACTIVLALLFRSWSTNSFHSIRLKSSNLKTICEFLSWWRHGLPRHPVWPGQMPMWQLTRHRSYWSVSVGKLSLGTKVL
jgi:hypothetical protein